MRTLAVLLTLAAASLAQDFKGTLCQSLNEKGEPMGVTKAFFADNRAIICVVEAGTLAVPPIASVASAEGKLHARDNMALKNGKYWAWIAGICIAGLYIPSAFFVLGIIMLIGLLEDDVKNFCAKKDKNIEQEKPGTGDL